VAEFLSHADQFLLGINSPTDILKKLSYDIENLRTRLDETNDDYVRYEFIDASLAVKAASEWIYKHVKQKYDKDIKNIAEEGLAAFSGVSNTFKHQELDNRSKWIASDYATVASAGDSSTFILALPKVINISTGERTSALRLLEYHCKRLAQLLAEYP